MAAGIMDLFHLLPQLTHPESFLETKERPGLVVLMIGLEQTLHKFPSCPAPSKMASPFREPLIKFLNRYAIHSIKYFLAADRMQDPHYFFRFLHFVKAPTGQPLRDTLTEHAEAQERLLDLLKVPAPGETVAMPNASFHAVHLVASVAKLKPQWLATTKPIMERLLERWRSPAREQRIQVPPLLLPLPSTWSRSLRQVWMWECCLPPPLNFGLKSSLLCPSLAPAARGDSGPRGSPGDCAPGEVPDELHHRAPQRDGAHPLRPGRRVQVRASRPRSVAGYLLQRL